MNMTRFRQVLAHIEEHPEEWDQRSTWRCFFAIGNRILNVQRTDLAIEGVEMFGVRDQELTWLYSFDRTLDDFRTIARRPFA